MKTRVRKKKVEEKSPAPKKKRAPRTEKDPLKGPLLLPPDEREKARKSRAEAAKKAPPPEPMPDDQYVSEEEDKERMVEEYRDRIRNPMTAIRAFCVECMGGYLAEVKRCERSRENDPKHFCPLHEFRLGNNPYHTRVAKKGESDDD